MRTLNQTEIAAVTGGVNALDILNALNGKPNVSIFASTDTKIITLAIALASPYIKKLLTDLLASIKAKVAA
ncbi:MAG: hypothetical protein KGL90_05655 [Burkholderiales bacterium]|nr:hypothetical protein [Burkholderiales bacterium]